MRVTVMGPLKISSQVRAQTGLSCPQSILLWCPSSTLPPTWGVWLPHCLFATFSLFFFFSSLSPLPSQPSVLKTVPFTARTGKRTSRLLCEASLGEEIPLQPPGTQMVWRLIPVVAHGPGNPGGLSLACSPLGHACGDVSEVGLRGKFLWLLSKALAPVAYA